MWLFFGRGYCVLCIVYCVLCGRYAANEAEPHVAAKLLWLHAEFLDAAGAADAADAMFAQSYAATGQVQQREGEGRVCSQGRAGIGGRLA